MAGCSAEEVCATALRTIKLETKIAAVNMLMYNRFLLWKRAEYPSIR